MSRLLLDKHPILVFPEMAVKIGLNESMILQQLNYWLVKSQHVHEGHKWIYNTYAKWVEQFPFWSKNTIIRAIANLEKQGLVVSGNFNQHKFDKTKWYRIDYQKFDELMGKSSTQNELTEQPNLVCSEQPNLGTPIPETTTEITSETTTTSKRVQTSPVEEPLREDEDEKKSKPIPYQKIIEYLNEKTESNFHHTAKDNRELIKARFNDGFTYEDFIQVIDNKVRQWRYSPKWDKFLRPKTLFAKTHFDNYLNEGDKGASTGTDFSKYDL
jgi:uncharacterized phage protein (TIGR02220 family)